jgi:3D (Asp-Asp-Asp) domain-containing protein
MFTKSVVACALGSALIGATLPESPLWAAPDTGEALTKKQVDETPETAQPLASRRSVRVRHLHRHTERVAKAAASRSTIALNNSGQLHAQLGTFAITAYTHYRNRRGGVNRTATGVYPQVGRTVAVDPRIVPLGTRLHIEGVGERIAEDTGRKIKGKKLDLFLPSVRECRRFGIRKQEVSLVAE